ncbi:MAG TPA: CoA pyrophosphatase [Caldithrix abyssi]|uniref:CoA pyrophosphatase n=1 Tax=Caldithrix abyssi TaxID=187145 RepID=A0A7V1LMK2_CALAY|nr:CoA pyrophosphatase [Caldithrix abyssi]
MISAMKSLADPAAELCRQSGRWSSHIRARLNAHVPQNFIFDKDIRAIPASVLIPLFFKDGQAHILFTKRSENLVQHKGQISFPGGRQDAADKDRLDAALRETEEEVGIARSGIEVLGQSDGMLTNTHYLVTPYVGLFSPPEHYRISEGEIDRLIEAPLCHFLDDAVFYTEQRRHRGYEWQVHYYRYGDDLIWGVTGFLLSAFLNIVFDAGRPLGG